MDLSNLDPRDILLKVPGPANAPLVYLQIYHSGMVERIIADPTIEVGMRMHRERTPTRTRTRIAPVKLVVTTEKKTKQLLHLRHCEAVDHLVEFAFRFNLTDPRGFDFYLAVNDSLGAKLNSIIDLLMGHSLIQGFECLLDPKTLTPHISLLTAVATGGTKNFPIDNLVPLKKWVREVVVQYKRVERELRANKKFQKTLRNIQGRMSQWTSQPPKNML